MFKPRTLIVLLLVVALGFSVLTLIISLTDTLPMGTFHADSYYLPLREYVEPSRQREMESMIIKLYNDHNQRKNSASFILHTIPVACLFLSLVILNWFPETGKGKRNQGDDR